MQMKPLSSGGLNRVTREQACGIADYTLVLTKRNIESCPFASQEEKDAEIHRREKLMNMLKSQMGYNHFIIC